MKKVWFNSLEKLNLFKFDSKSNLFSKIYLNNKQLNIRGVGYKSWINKNSNNINFDLGLTHYVSMSIPDGINVISKKTKLIISGKSSEKIGSFSNNIKNMKSPDAYKGKGIRFNEDVVKLKVGKVKN